EAKLCAQAQKAHGAAGQAAGYLPTPSIPADPAGDRTDQSDSAGLGELLLGGALQWLLWIRRELGGEEGSASHAACPKASGLRPAEVEYAMDVRNAGVV